MSVICSSVMEYTDNYLLNLSKCKAEKERKEEIDELLLTINKRKEILQYEKQSKEINVQTFIQLNRQNDIPFTFKRHTNYRNAYATGVLRCDLSY
jgi:hypothetical protein